MNNREIVLKVLSIIPETKKILNLKQVKIDEKEGIGNIVTNIDLQLEKYLKGALNRIFPNSQIISEESCDNNIEIRKLGLKFIVDPLDGTTNFINGWPHTVSIGIVNNEELIGGVIFEVLKDTVYVGIKNGGVFECNVENIANLNEVEKPIYDKAIIKKAVISYDAPYGAQAYKTTQKMALNLYNSGASLKTVGPISLDVLKTALGKENRPNDYNHAVWHSEVRAWDLAAATCILRELGGEIIGDDGTPLKIQVLTSPVQKISFIASGNRELLQKINDLREDNKE